MAGQVGDVYRVAVRMRGPDNQDIINVFHCKNTLLVDPDDDDIISDIVTEISNNYQALEIVLSDEQQSVDMSIQNVTQNTVLGTHEWTTAFIGDNSGDSIPPQASLFSYFRTGISRRVGRKFWGIVSETKQDGGLMVAIVASQMATFLAQWLGEFIGASGNGYLWGVYNDNLVPAFADYVEAVVSGRIMSQRRRRPTIGS